MRDLSPQAYRWSLWGVVALRAVAVAALCWWLPADQQWWRQAYEHNEIEYFRVAQGLAHGTPVASFRTIGFPLTLVPWIWLTGASSVDALIAPVALFQGVLLAGGTTWLIADIARRLTGRRRLALLTAACWAGLPLLIYLAVRLRPMLEYPGLRLHRLDYLLGLKLSSDPWQIWWVCLAVWAVTRALAQPVARRWPVIAGAAVGAAALTVMSSAIIAGTGLLWWRLRQWRAVWLFVGVAAGVWSMQLLYDRMVGASNVAAAWTMEAELAAVAVPAADEIVEPLAYPLPASAGGAVWSARYWVVALRDLLRKGGWALLLGLLASGCIALRGWLRLRAAAPHAAWLIALWVVPWMLLYAGYWSFSANMLRLSLPVVPALLLLIAASLTP